jgi:hypothetical protein
VRRLASSRRRAATGCRTRQSVAPGVPRPTASRKAEVEASLSSGSGPPCLRMPSGRAASASPKVAPRRGQLSTI